MGLSASAPSSMDRTPGFEPGDEGSNPSGRAIGVLFALASAKRQRIRDLLALKHGFDRAERIALIAEQADALDWAIETLAQLDEGAAHV